MYNYQPGLALDEATLRGLANLPVTVTDEETGLPVQVYRAEMPVPQLITGPHGFIPPFQTEESTRRVRVSVGTYSLTVWAEEVIGRAASAADRVEAVAASLDGLEDAVSEAASESPADSAVATVVTAPGTKTGEALRRAFVPRQDTSTYHLHVAPDGSDANDGTTSARPLATIQAAFDIVEESGPVAQGQWYINLAAGTYTVGNAQQVLTARSINPVIVRGPDVGGHPNVPTAIIDGTGGGEYRHGIRAIGDGVKLEVRDVKFVGFTTGTNDITRIAICGEHGADVEAVNCHVTGASWAGVYAFNTNRALVKGGIYDGNRFGVNVNDTQASVTSGAIFRNSTEAGVEWSRAARGHLDDCILEDNAVGLNIRGNAGVGTVSNIIRRNNVGIRTQDGGYYGETGQVNIMGTGADANKWRDFEFGAYSGHVNEAKNGASTIRTAYDRTARVVTGPTTPTLLTDLGEIPPARLWGVGKEMTVRVDGTIAATAAGAYLEVYIGPVRIPLEFYGTPSSSAFHVEVDFFEVTGGYRAFGRLMCNGDPVRTRSVSSTFDPKVANRVTVYGTTKTDACRITMYRASLSITG